MMHSLLISDLHLGEEREDLTQAFVQFCRSLTADCEALYILGDLSDAWIGDDDDSTTANIIRSTLRSVSDSGTRVFLMVGNRDFLMGEQLASDCGARLLPDPSVVDLHGHRTLLLHGDSLCIDDAEYMAFRAQIRDPAAQQMLLDKPLAERRELAAALRAQSKSANASKAEDIMDVNAGEVVEVLQAQGVDTMIHGHTHRPAIHELRLSGEPARRIVLGDWDQSAWYVRADSSGQTLHSVELQELLTH